MKKLYVAYGSNLNIAQMALRCPTAHIYGTGLLNNWELIYRGSMTGSYATIRRRKGSAVPVVVLYLVYQSCRMFQTHSDGYSFGFDSHIVGGQPAIYISCRMTCCQDDRTEECFARIRLYSFHFSLFDDQCIHPCGSLSVPICGWASTRMAVEAPCWQNTLSILSTFPRFLLRVYSFPSEYAPAPPSPKL